MSKDQPATELTAEQQKEAEDAAELDKYAESGSFIKYFIIGKHAAFHFYEKPNVQYFVAFIIFLNFLSTMFSVTEIALNDDGVKEFCEVLDWVFVGFFLVELVVNMYAHFFIDFWKSGWNIFDFVVIVIPLVTLSGWTSSVRILRLVRVVRVVRAVGKFDALIIVAESIRRSVGGVASVGIFMFGIMCCYAIVGVNFFGVEEMNDPDDEDKYALYLAFKDLKNALYTCFMMVTLEGWPDWCWNAAETFVFGPVFFVSFVLIQSLLMINLILAVFTTKMDDVEDDIAKERAAFQKEKEKKRAQAKQTMRTLSNQQGYQNAVAFDVDGDGIADGYAVDEDGDGVVDYTITAEQMAAQAALSQSWVEGEPAEVFSNTADKWCKGEVKSVDGDMVTVSYDVNDGTTGEKTVRFNDDTLRKPQKMQTPVMMAGGAMGGGGGGEAVALLTRMMKKLDGIEGRLGQLETKLGS